MTSSIQIFNEPPGIKESFSLSLFKVCTSFLPAIVILELYFSFPFTKENILLSFNLISFAFYLFFVACFSSALLWPFCFLVYRYLLGKDHRDISLIISAGPRFKKICNMASFIIAIPFLIYIVICSCLTLINPGYSIDGFYSAPFSSEDVKFIFFYFLIPFISFIFIWLLNKKSTSCFFDILNAHEGWYSAKLNSDKTQDASPNGTTQLPSVFDQENPGSIPDELMKWADLRNKGLINEDEYQKIRAKLLKKI